MAHSIAAPRVFLRDACWPQREERALKSARKRPPSRAGQRRAARVEHPDARGGRGRVPAGHQQEGGRNTAESAGPQAGHEDHHPSPQAALRRRPLLTTRRLPLVSPVFFKKTKKRKREQWHNRVLNDVVRAPPPPERAPSLSSCAWRARVFFSL